VKASFDQFVVFSAFFVKQYFPVRIFWFLIGGLRTVRQ